MMPQVIIHKRGDEVVAVIVAFVTAQFEIDAALLAGRFEEVGVQLGLKKLVGQTLVYQDPVGRFGIRFRDELCRIVCLPCALVVTQVVTQRLLAPGAVNRAADG